MSLVAYGSSDDSDAEENQTDDKPVQSPQGKILDPESRNEHNLVLEEQFSDSDSEAAIVRNNSEANDLDHMLKELPPPKTVSSGPIEDTDDQRVIVETDDLEDEVKPKPSQVADVEKPLPRKPRQPVKITIPALPDTGKEDGPVKKRSRHEPICGKSGLTSMLPAPVHAARKEAGRILLPYSLKKKSQTVSASASKDVNLTASPVMDRTHRLSTSLADYGSDSDGEADIGEPVSFFSLNSAITRTDSIVKRSDQEQMVGAPLPVSESDRLQTDSNTSIPTVPLPPTLARTSLNLPAPARSRTCSENILVDSVESSSSDNVAGGPDPNAPLTFKGGVTSQRTFSNRQSNSAMSSSSLVPSEAEGDQNMYFNVPYDGGMQYPESTDVEGFRQDNEFLRLQGKKQRGKEEITLIDVKADDYTDPSEITKHLTEEETYQSHRKKDNQPSGQQKRKHQIHYLAFQAKERELELKNQWSHNRQTKKQTQAKYGF